MLGNRQMMDRVRGWLREEQRELSGDRDTLQLAVAALLMEAARVDGALGERERAAVQRLLERKFRLSAEASQALAAIGEHQAERSAQLFGFTRTINERVAPERRRRSFPTASRWPRNGSSSTGNTRRAGPI